MAKTPKLFPVPTPPKPIRSQCPGCAKRKVMVHHNPEWGTWFDWFSCGDCGKEWEVDEEFPGRVISFRIIPVK